MINESMSKVDGLFLLASILSFAVIALMRINTDFYYDEIYSLVHYVFVPIQNIVWIYHDMNNHFLSNLINVLIVKVLRIPDLLILMDSPWKIRAVELLYASGAIYFLWRMKDVFGEGIARYSVLILITCIPFLNYATQVRGYCLNVFLAAALMYCVLHAGRVRKIAAAISTFLLLYSMPSNIYMVAGMMIGLLILRRFFDILWVAIGIGLAVLAYLPLIPGIMADPQLTTEYHFYADILTDTLPVVFHSFVSWRYLLIIPVFMGLSVAMKTWRREIAFLACVLIIPFLLAWLKGGYHYDRTFLVLLPAFCLLAALCLDNMKWPVKLCKWAFPTIALYCTVTMILCTLAYSEILKNDIINGSPRKVSLLCNYWQAHYHPKTTLREFKSIRSNSVTFFKWKYDHAALTLYIRKYFKDIVTENNDSLYVVSSEFVPQSNNGFTIERMNKCLDFHNIYLVRRTSAPDSINILQWLSQIVK